MNSIIVWVKEHPLLSAAFGIGTVVLLWLIFRSRGASEGGGLVIQGPSEAAIQAGLQSQQIAAGANAQAQHDQLQLQSLREQIAGTIAIETLHAQTNLAGQEAGIAGQIVLEGQRLDVEKTLGLAQLTTSLEAERLREESRIASEQIGAVTAIQSAQIMAQSFLAQAQIQSHALIRTTEIQAAANVKAQQSSNIWGTIGSIATGALLAFSDDRLKEDFEPVTGERNGLRLWSFRRKGYPGREIGFRAQEVEQHAPELVGMYPGTDVRVIDYNNALRRVSAPIMSAG